MLSGLFSLTLVPKHSESESVHDIVSIIRISDTLSYGFL